MTSLNKVAFKSDTAAVPYVMSYNNRYTPPMPQSTMDDTFLMQAIEQNNAAKKEKSKERWYKTGVLAQVGLAVAFGVMAIGSIAGLKMSKRIMGMGGKGGAADEFKSLTGVDLKWEDFAKEKNVASLNSKTTSKALKNVFKNIISSTKLSEKAKKWGGGSNKIDIMYLYGHGGTGKTYVAKQFAQETGSMFTCIKYPDIGSPYKDAASIKISNLFDEIIHKAQELKDRKLVVCIDEIDAVMRKVPDGAHGAEEVAKSRAALLTGLDKIKEKCNNVIVITTSNYHPQNGIVDPIALRRFNNKIEVPLPDVEQAEALLDMYLKKQNIDAISTSKFLESSKFKDFAKKLTKEGYSNGEIELIAEEAGKIFRSTLDGVADSELAKHPFDVKYLEQAMKMNGEAASKTNKLMDVKKNTNSSGSKTFKDLSFIQKLLLLFQK